MATDFPRTYEQWRRCITVDCNIDLSASFVESRLQALGDHSDTGTARFIELYGEDYLNDVIGWFERARSESGSA